MKSWIVKSLLTFRKGDCGAVTVDWVVLTAAIVGMAILALLPVATGTTSMSGKTADYVSSVQVGFMSE